QGVFVGSYAAVAQMLDEMAGGPGGRGVMLTFDDFVIGMEEVGTPILPLMRCPGGGSQAAARGFPGNGGPRLRGAPAPKKGPDERGSVLGKVSPGECSTAGWRRY